MSIRINVDPTNPGQFFACCGLLELADRLFGDAEGWFERKRFFVATSGTLETLLAILVMDPPEEVTRLDNGLPVKPLIAPLRFSFDGGATTSVTIDAWMTIAINKNKVTTGPNRPWNFWSGQQTSLSIWLALRLALAEQLSELGGPKADEILSQRVPLTGRFGFDPGAAWNALDVGFSPNTQQMPVSSSPATEMLAAVGLQRFRPLLSDDRQSFVYSTWGQPLLPSVAAAAASSLVRVAPATSFRGQVVNRGQYAALSYSTLLNGALHDKATDTD